MTRFSASVAPLVWLTVVSRGARGLIRQVGQVLTALRHRREVKHLAELDERILKDIGLSRSDVDYALSEPMFRNPSVLLVRSVERRALAQKPTLERKAVRPTVPVIRSAS